MIVRAVEASTSNIVTECPEGAQIRAVFVEMWLVNSANDGHTVVILEKTTDNQLGATFTEMADLFSYTNKKNILFTHQGLTANDGVGNPLPVIRQWFKIPKGKQRFGLGDRLVLTISNPSSNMLDRCGMMIFKVLT